MTDYLNTKPTQPETHRLYKNPQLQQKSPTQQGYERLGCKGRGVNEGLRVLNDARGHEAELLAPEGLPQARILVGAGVESQHL